MDMFGSIDMFTGAAATVTALAVGYFLMKSSEDDETVPSPVVEVDNKAEENKAAEDEAKYPGGPLSIYFGSQTGTAEGFAKELAEDGKKAGFNTKVHDLEDFDPEEIVKDEAAIYLMATYGEGEPTDNAVQFDKWLMSKDLEGNEMAGLKFTVFGLGNRQYEHFNKIGNDVDARLEKLGGTRVYDRGEGDDDGTLEDDFEEWKENLWPALQAATGTSGGGIEASHGPSAPTLEYEIKEVARPADGILRSNELGGDDREVNNSTKFYFQFEEAQIVVNRELRQDTSDGGSTKHIELELKDTGLEYETADNLGILPDNEREVVEKVCMLQGYDLNMWFAMNPLEADGKQLIPTPCSVEEALTRYCELIGVPLRKATVSHLASYATDEKEKEELAHLVSKEGKDDFNTKIVEDVLNIVELFEMFPSIQVPFGAFLEIVPRMQPRMYTISSSPEVVGSTVHVTASIVNQEKPRNRVHRGVTTTFLTNLSVKKSQKVRVFVRPSTFRLPKDRSTPITMVGPGTGIAPMRALLQLRKHQGNPKKGGDNILYFGCRNSKKDYIYKSELNAYKKDGTLTKLHLAFSREKKGEKVYVQHLLANNGDEVYKNLMQDGGFFYVCGGTSMGKDVMDAVANIIKAKEGISEEEATKKISALQQEGRYVQELWS